MPWDTEWSIVALVVATVVLAMLTPVLWAIGGFTLASVFIVSSLITIALAVGMGAWR